MERMVKEIVKPELDKKIGEAPADDKQYARKNKNWEEVSGGSGPGLFEAVFDVTPFEDVKAAWDRGDIVYVDYSRLNSRDIERGYLVVHTSGEIEGNQITQFSFTNGVQLLNGWGEEEDGWFTF